MIADGWATALSVLGPEAGMTLAGELGLAALFVLRDGDTLRDLASPAFGDAFPSATEEGAKRP
jgi:thiamine biosynthesis lipoprotein